MFTLDSPEPTGSTEALQPSQIFAREGDDAFRSGDREKAKLLYEIAMKAHWANADNRMTHQPILVCPEAIKGYEDLWLHATAENYKSLPRHTHDENGNEIPEPVLAWTTPTLPDYCQQVLTGLSDQFTSFADIPISNEPRYSPPQRITVRFLDLSEESLATAVNELSDQLKHCTVTSFVLPELLVAAVIACCVIGPLRISHYYDITEDRCEYALTLLYR